MTPARAAEISAWALWWASMVAMGASFAAIAQRDWPLAAVSVATMLMLAWASGSERETQALLEDS